MYYFDDKYDLIRINIKAMRKKDISWDEIKFACKGSEEGLKEYLKKKIEEEFWDSSFTSDVWQSYVNRMKGIEERSENTSFVNASLVSDGKTVNNYTPTLEETNAWFNYKKKLLEEYKFSKETTEEIEKTTTRILNRLKIDTEEDKPNRGLVIGNVQSGKTANMVALMTMAADWGWNFFIVLSGTIENLRVQTLNRIKNDLISEDSTIEWDVLDQLNHKNGKQFQDLNLNEKHRSRYYTVVLKNKSRLNNLVRWLSRDLNKRKQLKILIIDDEADQAGVNTASIAKEEVSAINRAIKQIVFNKNHKDKKMDTGFQSLNYVGYTATPYANVLNESPDDEETLFPNDFVATLRPSNEYFGPLQFFGLDDIDPFDFVNKIPSMDIKMVSSIHKNESLLLPQSLKDAIAWFYCSVSVMRYKGYKKPLSMLVHTSQRIKTHNNISEAINHYLTNTPKNELILEFEKVYKIQSEKITIEDFDRLYPEYPIDSNAALPNYDEFKSILEDLINSELTNIIIGEEGDLEYSKRVHICIDNSSSDTFVFDENAHIRLKYPTKENNLGYTSAFIVVGGSTLSRGLTIEGLVSTYFFRTVTQADTLMQMARWFGYRRGYELLPRVWMSDITYDRFVYLTQLDAELRSTMHMMEINNIKPSTFGIKVKNSPKPAFMRVTSKNKMQSAQIVDVDYSGSQNQTINYFNDIDSIKNNQIETINLIKYMNSNNNSMFKNNSTIWRNVDYNKVFDFLQNLKVPNTVSNIDYEILREWYEKVFNIDVIHNWNVVFAGTTDGLEVDLGGHKVYTVNRSKFPDSPDELIRIGVLRAPSDTIIDIQKEEVAEEVMDLYKKYKLKNIDLVRAKSGLEKTPLLIIYLINKDSYPQRNTNRVNLNAKDHLIGTFMYIPVGDSKASYSSNLKVRINVQPEQEEEVDEITS